MNTLLLGTLIGILFGLISVLLMIPLKFDDKRTAMLGAFINRFSIVQFLFSSLEHLGDFSSVLPLAFGEYRNIIRSA